MSIFLMKLEKENSVQAWSTHCILVAMATINRATTHPRLSSITRRLIKTDPSLSNPLFLVAMATLNSTRNKNPRSNSLSPVAVVTLDPGNELSRSCLVGERLVIAIEVAGCEAASGNIPSGSATAKFPSTILLVIPVVAVHATNHIILAAGVMKWSIPIVDISCPVA